MTKNKKVPALRFPGFEGEWEEKKLGDIFKINAGGDIDPKNVSEIKTSTFKYPIYANAAKDKGFYGYSDIYKIEENVVTVAGRGVNLGIAHARDHKFYPIVRLLILIPKNQENIYFFEYVINNLNILLESTGVPQLTAPQFSNYKIKLPTLLEQQKIAAFLTAIDTRIQQLTRKKALLEQYKKGVMQKIFSREIRFKDEEGKEWPEWEEMIFGKVFSFYSTNSLSRSLLNYENGEVKNIHYGDIHTTFKVNFDLSKEYVPFINSEIDLSKIPDENYCKEGDLVIADASEDYADVGKAIEIVNLDNKKLLAGLHTLLARDNKQQTVIGFKAYLMQTPEIRKQIMRVATGISVLGISKGNLSKIKIPLPSLSEQQKIATFLTALDAKINQVGEQITRTQAYKKGLLQGMFV